MTNPPPHKHTCAPYVTLMPGTSTIQVIPTLTNPAPTVSHADVNVFMLKVQRLTKCFQEGLVLLKRDQGDDWFYPLGFIKARRTKARDRRSYLRLRRAVKREEETGTQQFPW